MDGGDRETGMEWRKQGRRKGKEGGQKKRGREGRADEGRGRGIGMDGGRREREEGSDVQWVWCEGDLKVWRSEGELS